LVLGGVRCCAECFQDADENTHPDPDDWPKVEAVAELPTEEGLGGVRLERAPRARREGAPVRVERPALFDTGEGDAPGQGVAPWIS
jgi:hypothetical protein